MVMHTHTPVPSEATPPLTTGLRPAERKFLNHFFALLWLIFALINTIASYATIHHYRTGKYGELYSTHSPVRRSWTWPAPTPRSQRWPPPQRLAFFSTMGPSFLIDGVYACAWDQDGVRYAMDTTRVGFPFTTMHMTVRRVHSRDSVRYASPPQGIEPKLQLAPTGLLLNPTIYTAIIWLPVAGIYTLCVVMPRNTKSQGWTAQGLCGGCGYEIRALPVCPECGARARPETR